MERLKVLLVFLVYVLLLGVPNAYAEVSTTNLTSPSGSFSTPTFPSHYPPATEYIWLIKGNDGMYIKLKFDVVDIEAYRGKCIDIVEIKDGDGSEAPLIGGFCNANKPTKSFTSSGNALRIWFQSARNSDGGSGFNASYTTIKKQDCGGMLHSFPGNLSTPRYPLPYPDNLQCQWNLVAPPGMYIHVEFHGVYHLEVDCMFLPCKCVDTLEIKDGNKPLPHPPYIGYCVGKPHAFTSKTSSVSMVFVTNSGGRYEGFNATYTASLTPGCGADFHSNDGLITSPNYPHGYPSLTKCIWRITVAADHYISLHFQEFDVIRTNGAHSVDGVEIHDGYTRESPLLGKFFNDNYSVDTVNSTRNQMFILFQSGYNRWNAKGFHATYSSQLKHKESGKARQPRHQEFQAESSHPYKPSSEALATVEKSWILIAGSFATVVLLLCKLF